MLNCENFVVNERMICFVLTECGNNKLIEMKDECYNAGRTAVVPI